MLRMMGSLPEELNEIVGGKEDRSIIGFLEEEKRAKQRSAPNNTSSWKLPQGSYKFSQFRPLELPGIELDPAPDIALEIMHKLASDPGIVSIMNKHRWSVGLMTEMAPLGYVGITPKCILGVNKNHGEEISLRLRTDDLKGFRKYESIKKTLLHELAHMVYSDHDANFFALDKQLNEECVALDWTKAKGHKWGGLKDYEENHSDLSRIMQSDSLKNGYKVGGSAETFRPNARSAAAVAALHRLGNVSIKPEEDGKIEIMRACSTSDGALNHSDLGFGLVDTTREQPQNTESLCNTPHCDTDNLAAAKNCGKKDDCEALVHENESENVSMNRDSKKHWGHEKNIDEDNIVEDSVAPGHDAPLKSLHHFDMDTESGFARNDTLETKKLSNVTVLESNPKRIEDGQSVRLTATVNEESTKDKPDPDETMDEGDLDVGAIQEPSEIVCRRLQQAITKLKEEASPSEALLALHTLFVILRNAIEYPQEAKFKRLKKANPLFQSRVAKFKGALEVLYTVGFSEQPSGVDGDDHLILERNDPGLLWLARSSVEICMA